MSDSLYVKVGDAVEQVNLGANSGPEYVERIETLEAGQLEQDTAIAAALPKSGGEMTGEIKKAGGYAFRNTNPEGSLTFTSATTSSERAAYLQLFGANHASNPGAFVAAATLGDQTAYNYFMPDGRVIFSGKHAARSVDGVAAASDGNVPLNALKTTGGEMTGSLFTSNVRSMAKTNTNSFLIFTGGNTFGNFWNSNDGSGAELWLAGASQGTYSGWAILRAFDGTDNSFLELKPSGVFMLNAKNIVRSVNGTDANEAGNVSLSLAAKGSIGSAWASNSTSITLPSGGTWFVFNILGYGTADDSYYRRYYGVSSKSGSSSTGFNEYGATYSGGTTVYAKQKYVDDNNSSTTYSNTGKLCAVRIS